MTTAAALIRKALGRLNIVTPARKVRADELATGLEILNDWLDEQRLPPLFARTTTEVIFTLPPNTPMLMIGTGQAINVARPIKLESTGFSRVGTMDYPIEVVDEAEYNLINQKALGTTWPSAVFFDGGSKVYFYPTGNCEIHLFVNSSPGRFPTLTADVELDPGYENPIVNCLAVEMAPNFNADVPELVLRAARRGRRRIANSNLTVPQLITAPIQRDTKSAFLGG